MISLFLLFGTADSTDQRLTTGSLLCEVLTETWVSTLSSRFLTLLPHAEAEAEVLTIALCLGVLSLLVFWPDLLISVLSNISRDVMSFLPAAQTAVRLLQRVQVQPRPPLERVTVVIHRALRSRPHHSTAPRTEGLGGQPRWNTSTTSTTSSTSATSTTSTPSSTSSTTHCLHHQLIE